MSEQPLIADPDRGSFVITLCRRAAEVWADGADSTAERYCAAAFALIGHGEFVDSAGAYRDSIGNAPRWRSD